MTKSFIDSVVQTSDQHRVQHLNRSSELQHRRMLR